MLDFFWETYHGTYLKEKCSNTEIKGALISKKLKPGKRYSSTLEKYSRYYGLELLRVRRWQLLTGVEPDGGGRDVIILAFICNFYTPKSPKYSIGPLNTFLSISIGLV